MRWAESTSLGSWNTSSVTRRHDSAPGAPLEGLLIASPVQVAGPFDPADRYASLRKLTPVAVIGHSMLVYDLDLVAGAVPR